jgi:hypothetical protein
MDKSTQTNGHEKQDSYRDRYNDALFFARRVVTAFKNEEKQTEREQETT